MRREWSISTSRLVLRVRPLAECHSWFCYTSFPLPLSAGNGFSYL
ncbi:hypothetical protein FOPG_14931 [Fusarium oxysporum f. sp. conglutinans race 2 54008]|uniref:Uncharacterized protein n=1 Tax=Fusarium oxysporum f. sp. conglutinans race 2 54008 TaxID=1089457 RepID=X0HB30_FUSOX|nr:hypothetical protein FOPG_14931 [Fusarium oxysporum f. sp. conglutinans race 2 54008]